MTPSEYDKLPLNPRVELVDAVVHVMAPATRLHQEVVDALKIALSRLRPSDLVVVREQELRLREDHRRNPDLMVIHRAADDPSKYSFVPADVVLAVEVVSPGTETIDRMHKHAEYCNARVPHYWRVEIRPTVSVHTYQLGETGVYLETGSFAVGDTIVAPGLAWAKVAVSDLIA
jgi:Uma2 family endonuclease